MKGCYKASWYTCGGKKVPIQSNALTMYAFNFTKLVEKAKALSFHNSYVGIIQARRGEVGRKETWKPYAAVYNGCEKDEKSRKQMFHDWGVDVMVLWIVLGLVLMFYITYRNETHGG